IDHTERETTGVVGKAERLTWHKAWTMVSTGFSISYTLNKNGMSFPIPFPLLQTVGDDFSRRR
ncbi:hypothetical protein, partial [Klebsiella pneumoniae]|uniref:hypothetical protein n=1 Tax=Klebsiella pneumoniae TaxID=573 RepID=UPI002FF23492